MPTTIKVRDTGGTKKDASGKAIPGQSFGYAYDDISNRLSEQRGMPEMLFSYAANNLNQYTQRTVPGIIPEPVQPRPTLQ